jgi:hypothetical protein
MMLMMTTYVDDDVMMNMMMAMMMTMYVGYFSLANNLPKSIEKNSPFAAEQTACPV